MITQEQFNKIEDQFGCGYWKVCWDHACPCAITTENKGLQESIYNSLNEKSEKVAKDFEEDENFNSEDEIDDEHYLDDDTFDIEDYCPLGDGVLITNFRNDELPLYIQAIKEFSRRYEEGVIFIDKNAYDRWGHKLDNLCSIRCIDLENIDEFHKIYEKIKRMESIK